MKKAKLILTAMVLLSAAIIQKVAAQNYKWVTGDPGTISSDNLSSVSDNSGNTIIVGSYLGTIDVNFSDGPGDTAMMNSPSASYASFFAKYNSEGSFSWGKRLYNGKSGRPFNIKKVATDNLENIYIGGDYLGSCDFNPSDAAADTVFKSSTTNATGSTPFSSTYVAKYDSSGNFVWVMNFNGGLCTFSDMTIKNNMLYLSGTNRTGLATYLPGKNTDFNPSPLPADTLFLDGPAVANAFIAGFGLDGSMKFAKRLNNTTTFSPFNIGIDADSEKNTYLVGSLSGSADFNASSLPADTAYLTLTNGVYLAKYDSSGNYLWATSILDNTNIDPSIVNKIRLLISSDNEIYISGNFTGSADFDLQPGIADTLVLNAGSGSSSFISRYNNNGNLQHAYSLGDTGINRSTIIGAWALSDSNHLYIGGDFTGSVDFNMLRGVTDTAFRTNTGSNANPDIFFAKYDNDTLVWSRKVGTSASQILRGLTVNEKQLTIYGNFNGDVIFDPMPPANMSSQLLGDGTYLSAYRTYPLSSNKELLSYSFTTPPASGTITSSDSVLLNVPFGTTVNNLVASFTVSANAIAHVGNMVQVSATTPNNFTNVLTYTIMAEDSTTKEYFVKVTVEADTTVGITEHNKANSSFKVWPNPALDVLHFEQVTDVRLYDINGRIIREGRKVKSINVSGIVPGTYTIENEKQQKRKITIR